MPGIVKIADDYGLRIIEDCALALGAKYKDKSVGLFGDAGCFSFYPAKHITTGEGGMFVTRHRDVAEAVKNLRAFGVDRTLQGQQFPGSYDVTNLGLNYRMSELQAALGRSQLSRIGENLKRRRENFVMLKQGLTGSLNVRVLDATSGDARSSYYCQNVILQGQSVTHRNEVVAHLKSSGIGTSIYYPQPVPRMRYYQVKYGYNSERFTHAIEISDNSVALPVGPHVTSEDIQYIIDRFECVLKR
jgi:dTDP-4-amino-4,6-dideoxygalactose transaminase